MENTNTALTNAYSTPFTINETGDQAVKNNTSKNHGRFPSDWGGKIRLKRAVRKMLEPWFNSPLNVFERQVMILGDTTKCYKTLTAIVTITDLSLRILTTVGIFFLMSTIQICALKTRYKINSALRSKLQGTWAIHLIEKPSLASKKNEVGSQLLSSSVVSIAFSFFLYENLSTKEQVFCATVQTSIIGLSVYKQVKAFT
ncbi:MAG: hypothetical protein SP1CHLAM9_02400 [Chlamydiia bacterium]|nr:hypothetical protein [Chlamydiia bacterium]MCH9624454.1 hypothetical protein [Chlamydiia bacterium]